MNKLKTTDTGGFDCKLNDFRFLSKGVEDAFKGILSAFTPTATTYILSGCTYTLVSGTMTMSEGYVAIDGEVCYVPAHSISFTTPANLYWDVEISYDSEGFKQFENFDWHDTYEVRVAKIKYNNTAVPLGKTSLLSTKNISTLLKETVGTPSGGIIMWSGAINTIPIGWVLCDGTNGTPNLIDRFIVGAGSIYNVGDTGGQSNFTINNNNLPQHKHASGDLKSKANNDEFITIPYDIAYHPSATSGMVNNGITSSSSNGPDWSGQISGNLKWNLLIDGDTDFGGGVASPTSIDNKPPYYALAYIMKV